MRSYIVSRILLTIPMILLLLTVVFLILRILPGDPVLAIMTKNAPPELIEQRRHELGLDKPIYLQYFDYVLGLSRGDFGKSMIFRTSDVATEIWARLPATVELAFIGILVAVGVGVLLGTISATHRNTVTDQGIRIYGMVIYAIPIFFMGLVLQLIFSVYLGWLPTSGRTSPSTIIDRVTGFIIIDSLIAGRGDIIFDAMRHTILPAVTLGLYLSGIFSRLTRTHMIQTLKQDFVTAARARGIAEGAITRSYALRNAMVPLATMLGLQFAALLGGAILTETTFNWPGIGAYLVDQVYTRDYNVIQGIVVVYAVFVAGISLFVDIAYAFLDPRVRL